VEETYADLKGLVPLAQRRAKDPDAKLAWEGGTLRCPVRPHDYRIVLFTPK